MAYLREIVKESMEQGFMRESGKWDVEGLHVYLNKPSGLDGEKMEV
jgi:hypothetical protein